MFCCVPEIFQSVKFTNFSKKNMKITIKQDDNFYFVKMYVKYLMMYLCADTRLIAIHCEDIMIYGGILASLNTGLVTDSSWKCTSTYQQGWYNLDFDDSPWSPAYEIAVNDGNNVWSRPREGISLDAYWIWTPRWRFGDKNVYCRRLLTGKS